MLILLGVSAVLIVLGISLTRNVEHVRAAQTAADSLDALDARLDDAQTLAREGQSAAHQYARAMDSIASHPKIDTVYRVRQYTPVVMDTGDVMSVAQGVAAIAAERDTAIADRDSARMDVMTLTLTIQVMDSTAIAHAAADVGRFGALAASLDSARTTAHEIRDVIRPRWYKRWGSAAVRGVKVASVAAIAFALGRAT